MKLVLQRYADNGQATAGLLFIADEITRKMSFVAHTLEDEHRDDKVKGETRVKAGLYEIALQKNVTPMTERYRKQYPWFQFFLMLLKVEGFSHIYLHNGTKEQHTDGCLLTADQALAMFDDDGRVLSFLLSQSTINMKRIYEIVIPKLEEGEKVFIEIRDEFTY